MSTLSDIRSRTSPREGGFAVVAVLLVGAILVLLSTLMVARGVRQMGNTAGSSLWEEALATAEAGLDTGLNALEWDPDFNTGETLPASFATPEAERTWALEAAEAHPDEDVVATPAGEFVLVKPENAAFLYAVGFSPDRATLGRRTRVVRVGYALSEVEWTLELALLVGDDLEMSGDANIVDTNGNDAADVHANGIVDSGGSYEVEGCLTSSESAFPAVLNCPASPLERDWPIPVIDPLVMYPFAQIVLCPDEQAYAGPAYPVPGLADGDLDPCTGDETPVAAPGWTSKKKGGVVEWNPGSEDGVFYVHEGNVDGKLGSNTDQAEMTVIVSAVSGGTCSGKSTGHLTLSGNSNVTVHPSLSEAGYDVAIVTQGDIMYRGGATVGGAILAHEQIDYRGEAGSWGPVVAASVCDTPGSPVNQTELFGNSSIGYPGPVRTPFTDSRLEADVVAWHEL